MHQKPVGTLGKNPSAEMPSKPENTTHVSQLHVLSTGAVGLAVPVRVSTGNQMVAFCITDARESGCQSSAARAYPFSALLSGAPEANWPRPKPVQWVWLTSTEMLLGPPLTSFKHCFITQGD